MVNLDSIKSDTYTCSHGAAVYVSFPRDAGVKHDMGKGQTTLMSWGLRKRLVENSEVPRSGRKAEAADLGWKAVQGHFHGEIHQSSPRVPQHTAANPLHHGGPTLPHKHGSRPP